jgi:phytoene dehydrogenase-like protein
VAALELNRRELITAFLGAAVAGACQRSAPRARIPGTLVDRAAEWGHALRGAAPLPRSAALQPVDVAVVGAGPAGLSAAWRLRGAGVSSLAVLEVDEAPGGTSRSGRNAVSAFPWGAHYLPAPNRDGGPVMRLLRGMGLVTGVDEKGRPHFAEQALVREPDERLFYRGHWYDGLYLRAGASPEDLDELRRFEAAMQSYAQAHDGRGRKAFDVPLERGSDDAEWTGLDRLSMAEWMEREGYRSPRLRWVVDYACRDDFGADASAISAYAATWYFAARHGDGVGSDGYLTWPEGNGRLVAELQRALAPGQLSTQRLVHTVEPVEGGVAVHGVEAGTQAPFGLLARRVVVAAPRFVAARLYAPWRSAPPPWLSAFQYTPWAVANLTVSEHPGGRGAPLAWDNVLYESQSLGYVVATHQRERVQDSGPTVLTWYYPLGGADVKAERGRLLSSTYEDWEALVLADLSVAHPEIARTAQRLEVMRWGHAMVRPRPGFLFGPERAAAVLPRDGVHFAHSDLGGLALFEEACHHGVRAAEEVLAGLGRPVDSWL